MIINQPPLCCKISGESSGHVSLDKRKPLAATEEEGGSIEFQSDDTTKMIFLKLWVLFNCLEQSI